MDTIANLKEQTVAQTPLLLFEITLANGQVERWSSHQVTVSTQTYEARVLRHNLFAIRSARDHGIDAVPKISLTAANADSQVSQLESTVGFKGAKIKATFLFYDLILDTPDSESMVVFQGIMNPPEEIREETFRLSAVNRMSMQRVLLPPVRIQRYCPWAFPASQAERVEAVSGGMEGAHSRFFRCGYSAGEPGGLGNLDGGGSPFTTCNLTRSDCIERGMFDQDSAANTTRRFGGIEFVPGTIRVRSHTQREQHDAALVANEARYNDFVPLLYGTVWVEPPVVFARNDGNLTRIEVLLGHGNINQVLKVIVNNVEIPAGVTGQDMTGSGWWNLFSDGNRTGGFNLNFVDPSGNPQGDPYGNMACLSVVVPNQINDGRVLPRVKVLVEGRQVETFDGSGVSQGMGFNSNPTWVLLDMLRLAGWKLDEIDVPSFEDAASFCDQTIAATDNNGNAVSVKRFECNVAIRSRRTAADVIRGTRNNARLQLTYRSDGKLAAYVENSLALQQPTKPVESNSPTMVNGGWPAYSYVDGSVPGVNSGILRNEDDSIALRLWSRPMADTPNRFSIEFADRYNEYQQDSLAMVDAADVNQTGQEITGRLASDGLPTFDQAARCLKFFLDKSLHGNRYVAFETSVKAMGQKVGDIITLTYVKEGLVDQPFRIIKIEPAMNYRSVGITAQIHDDAWYNDTNGQLSLIPETRRQPEPEPRVPDPLYGFEFDPFGDEQFGVVEYQVPRTDGTILTEVEVSFTPPQAGQSLVVGIPIVNLQPNIQSTGGTLNGGQTLYYAITAVDADGFESNPSFVVRAKIPAGTSTNTVEIDGLSFTGGTASFTVYRGPLPFRLFRIATAQPVASSFVDTGLSVDLTGAPDPNYDHANFYWRLEDIDEQFADISSPNSVGSTLLSMTTDAFVGHSVRILRGKGVGQERAVVSNTATTAVVTPDWETEPDVSSVFVISENTWHFGGRARTSPARFEVPNRRDQVVQITGRSANAHNVESLEPLGLVTRWRIGGGGLGVADTDVPPAPGFAVAVHADGVLEFSGIGFSDLQDTQSISTGTFRLYYREELSGPSSTLLAAAVSPIDTTLTLSQAGSAQVGDFVQIESEIMLVDDVQVGGTQYTVQRGECQSTAAAHSVNAPLFHLRTRTIVVPFEESFFGTPAAGNWSHGEWLPDVRLACADLWVTNVFGMSPVFANNYSQLADGGLRTLRGGQFNFQVEGLLAVLNDAVPAVSVQENLSVRDIYASVKSAPTGADIQLQINQDGVLLATLSIVDGQVVSAPANGAELPVLQSGSYLTLDISAVGTTFPGRDLTVTIRV